ncbi:MFS transporter [Bailinhaonella thermotolerans]|uniref:MFS transporter n=1 Tax=Bailinhaonella thermotolerans TaxID=1070861 RepID=A0A3A4BCC5_9ACTN|nr:MFS transporter [Bailinhaonella thermotolerans]
MVVALAVTQTAGYGALYYAFSVFLTPMQGELGAGVASLTVALTLGRVVAGMAAPVVGRWLDRWGGRWPMTAGSLLGAAGLLLWSRVETLLQLYLVFVLIGVASAMVLYDAALTIVVGWFDPRRRARALLAVTIVAGLASTVFVPLTGFLVERYGWRLALVILGLGYGVVAVPLHGLVLRRRKTVDRSEVAPPNGAVRERAFLLLAAAFVAQTCATTVVGVLLVTYLIVLGHSPVFAAAVAGLLGVLSVTGRLVTSGLRTRFPVALVTAAVFALQATAAALLPVVGRSPAGAIAAVVLFGLGFGVATIARPTLLADRYGTAGYGALSGALALPVTVAAALAPLAAALLAEEAGYAVVLSAVAAACAVGAVALLGYHRIPVVSSEAA